MYRRINQRMRKQQQQQEQQLPCFVRLRNDDSFTGQLTSSSTIHKNGAKLHDSITRVTFSTLTCNRMMNASLSNHSIRMDFAGSGSVNSCNISPCSSTTHVSNVQVLLENTVVNSTMELPYISSPRPLDGIINEPHDPKALQESLMKAFPESLKLITTDEVMVEAVIADNAEDAGDSGYHRQFTELVLREIYSLLIRIGITHEAHNRYLFQQSDMDLDETTPKTLKTSVSEEGTSNLSNWGEGWYKRIKHTSGVLCAVTVRPPKFLAGMLWNGVDRFLFEGTSFIEEARILQIRLNSGGVASEGTKALSSVSDIQTNTFTSSHSTVRNRTHVRLLLREFTSISRTGMGCMVQTFSLIPDHVSVHVPRCQTVPYGLIQTILDQCEPGAISRAFSLQMLLPSSMRYVDDIFSAENTLGSTTGLHSLTFARGNTINVENTLRNRMSYVSENSFPSTSPTRGKRNSVQSKTLRRQPLGDEAYLRFTNPKLFACVIQHSPALLTTSANIIREYLKYSQRLRFRTLIRRLMWAVKTIQRFCRHRIEKKKRVVNHILQRWEKLELESREQLKTYTLSPTTTDRIDFIVATVLWQHIVTTETYKRALLEEQFSERRAAYRKWYAQRMEEDQLRRKYYSRKSLLVKDNLHVDNDSTVGIGMRRLSSRSFISVKEEQTTVAEGAIAAGVKKINSRRSSRSWISKWEDVLHARFGWYIDPEELLQESHRRLLISLRNSILIMSEVQEELKKISLKRSSLAK